MNPRQNIEFNTTAVPGIATNILRNVSAAIQDNLPALAFTFFAAFTKTWLSTRNNNFSIYPRPSVRQPPRFEGHEIEANLVINIHPTDLKRFWLRAQGTQGGHVSSLD